MKGDFSRIRFNRGRHYTAVLQQQGRVELDADANEQRMIDGYLRRAETVDVIGEYGTPMDDPGFAISVTARGEIRIGKGRYYVAGLLCDNLHHQHYDDQPYLLDASYSSTELLEALSQADSDACLCVYLEVWQRLVTALDDPCLGEPALGQADTTARVQTVWRVVASLDQPTQDNNAFNEANNALAPGGVLKIEHDLKRMPIDNGNVGVGIQRGSGDAGSTSSSSSCSCKAMYAKPQRLEPGTMSAQTAPATGDCGCQPIPAAGYVGLENQLYRVEIHQAGDPTSATFKWSRENGSVVVAIQSVSGSSVVVNSLGPDANLGFQQGQWVEISDDTYLFGDTPNQPGLLYQIQHIEPSTLTVTMTTTVQPVNTSRNARMRRWDQAGPSASASGIALSSNWIALENGIQVCFGSGNFTRGDAWTIPARAATGQIDWPPCGGNGKTYQLPHIATIHRAPLACIHANTLDQYANTDNSSPFTIDDCRRQFPNLTDLTADANAKAIHITQINWTNDDAMTLDTLIKNGLVVTFDSALNCPLTPANFIITLETAIILERATDNNVHAYYAFSEQNSNSPTTPSKANLADAKFDAVERPTPTAFRSPDIIDSKLTQKKDVVSWTLPYKDVSTLQDLDLIALNAALVPGLEYNWPGRVRVKLPGHSLYAAGRGNTGTLYLDGQAFGQTARTADNSRDRIDLQFPTGNSDKASDFESWFYLYPVLAVTEVDLTYSAMTVQDNGTPTVISTTPAATTQPIVQQATIYLNYTAIAPATIHLSLNGDATVASVPSTVQVKAGDASVTVTVTLSGVPAEGVTDTFALSAAINTALGTAAAQTASFTVTGQIVFT
ncbi:hypothetical protein EO087_06135 [Dyella sp. M7H15-1]|uniref:DUF6519 domain-containing protein n=1 Tax=Dyella sp. M7H15-1 TaxID=2501295 RepID=UPI001004DF07|nr:DUF6519 domain-containing protein [Dyella sp. M7H15-1]QAU23613.1 hypothetical protein EO087_06135 [Dyella sp. M7H15-1]